MLFACSSPQSNGKRGGQNTNEDDASSGAAKKDAGGEHCGSSSCADHASCDDSSGAIVCTCDAGYQGDGKSSCDDIDECKTNNGGCGDNATCVNLPGSMRCDCNAGAAASGDSQCMDLCAMARADASQCDPNARCAVSGTSASCSACDPGYTGDGKSCTDHRKDCPSECNGGSGSDHNAVCSTQNGKYSCACAAGYDGSPGSCTNIDECAKGTDNCDSATSKCMDTDGGFLCGCQDGYTLSGGKCVDIDECKDKNASPCPTNSTCVNDPGKYHCSCTGDFAGDDFGPSDKNDCYCDLSGWWAMREDQTLCWDARTLNNVTYIAKGALLSASWELHYYTYDGTNIVDVAKSCGEDLDPDLASPYLGETYSSFIPQDTIDAVYEHDRMQMPSADSAVLAPELVPGSMFTASNRVSLLGIDLGPDPLHADWPVDYTKVNPIGGDPPAWVDSDMDGEPGLSIWPKVPSQMAGPCADQRVCYPNYSYPPADLSGTTVNARAGCQSVATRSINNVTANLDTCTHMTGEIMNLKSEGRFEGCTLVPQSKWKQDFGCAQSDWSKAASASSSATDVVKRCADSNLMLFDTQDQSQSNSISYEMVKIGGAKDSEPSCGDVRAALPPMAMRDGPATKCPL